MPYGHLPYRPPSRATTNPSRLGHTKRQRHVRHNISSSGKRATCNVATYVTCRDRKFTGESIERRTLHYLYSSHSFPPSCVCSENGRDGPERRYPSKLRPDSRSLSLPSTGNEDGASACVITARDAIGSRM